MKRVLSALALLPPLILLVWLGPRWAFSLAVGAAVALGLDEVFRMFGIRKHFFLYIPALLLGLLLSIGSSLEGRDIFQFAIWVSIILFPLWTLASRLDLDEALKIQMGGFFGLLFVAVLLGYLPKLMRLPHGRELLSFLFVVIWLGDIASYYVGKNLGRQKLAPAISPNKTVEGSLAGLGGNLLGVILSRALFFHHLPLSHMVAAGLLIGLFGQLGDLSESALKRMAGVKDSGSIIPGHGGLLDRIDSILFAAPVLYYYILLTSPAATG